MVKGGGLAGAARKVNVRRAISLREAEDADLIEFLDGMEKGAVSSYIRKLVRGDMKARKRDPG
jgi:NAD(P)H-flavin reductase